MTNDETPNDEGPFVIRNSSFRPSRVSSISMTSLYSGLGLHFRYPEEWGLSEDRSEQELSVTVRPDGDSTAFWSATLLFDRPSAEDALQAVVEAFEEEYEEIDVYPADAKVARRDTLGRDIDFVCLELTNSAFVRVFGAARFTVVVLYQATDGELDSLHSDFRQITSSLECELDAELGFR
jgi:hypothetical protein